MDILKKETVSWSLQNILLALLPFLLGALFRILYKGEVEFSSFDASELSFSLAILFILILQSVNNLSDDNLKRSLSVLLQLGIFFALAFFASSLILKIHLDTQMANSFNEFIGLSTTNPSEIPNLISEFNSSDFHKIIHRLNIASIVLFSSESH